MSSPSQSQEDADASREPSAAVTPPLPEPAPDAQTNSAAPLAQTDVAPSSLQGAGVPTPAQPNVAEVYPGQMPSQPWQGYPPGQMPYPGYPAPSQPYPPQGYPGWPSQPYPPQSYPGAPGQPYAPGQPNASQPWLGYPTGQMPWPDTAGGVATMAPPVPQRAGFAALARPLPLWAILAGSVVVALVLVGLELLGSDWADGATRVGIAAGALALLVILATGIRSLAGMATKTNEHRRAQYTGAALVTVLFLVVSGAGIGLQAPIHRLQAGVLDSSQRWQQAINELELAGETPPASEALARVYDEWGEHLNASQQYQRASDTLFIVLDTYSAATQGIKRAQADIIATSIAWGNHDAQQHNYQDATRQFDFALNQPYCQADCQAQVSALDATAYYDRAEADISAQNYTDAIQSFNAIATRFATTPEAQKIHGDYAVAIYQAGHQDIATASSCPAAIPLYQQLTKDFADTPQAKQAATALAAPQPVQGQFASGPPANTFGIVSLLKNARIDLKTQDFIGTPTLVSAALIKSDGSFVFPAIAQGTYALAWQTLDKSGNETSFSFYYTVSTGDPYYQATVGPLCPFDFGAIADPVYNPPTNNAAFKQESVIKMILAGHSTLVTLTGVTSPRHRRFAGTR